MIFFANDDCLHKNPQKLPTLPPQKKITAEQTKWSNNRSSIYKIDLFLSIMMEGKYQNTILNVKNPKYTKE